MQSLALFKCLSDPQRVRILALLLRGPLCVCHFMEILGADQVKVSKQMRYMKELGLVTGERVAQWMVYRRCDPQDPGLLANLEALEEIKDGALPFDDDRSVRSEIVERMACEGAPCAAALI